MRKADLEEGVAYATKRDGKVTVTDLSPRTPMGAKSPRVQVRAEDGEDTWHSAGSHFLLGPSVITRRWDDPEEEAKRERKAELDRQSDRARELLKAMGLTVAGPGWERHFGTAGPESWVEGSFRGRRVCIDLDAFLGLIGTIDVAKALADGAQAIRVAAERAEVRP